VNFLFKFFDLFILFNLIILLIHYFYCFFNLIIILFTINSIVYHHVIFFLIHFTFLFQNLDFFQYFEHDYFQLIHNSFHDVNFDPISINLNCFLFNHFNEIINFIILLQKLNYVFLIFSFFY